MKYKLNAEQMAVIVPIIRRLEGANIIMSTLAENIGIDKANLWETVYQTFPELRGKPAAINEHKREVVVQELSSILTPGGNVKPFPGRN